MRNHRIRKDVYTRGNGKHNVTRTPTGDQGRITNGTATWNMTGLCTRHNKERNQ